ncbi:CLUMA_CG010055, isoform A [Clunio marinus]|uniref:CLUMA_CG010055, isoform A n=1 Tax=Clunio marinus TaxID=568069 RepID=A0A1J1I8K0_9DIPT|nr:CLUMA_CG010055, isoform A [Clunio marinus]
MNICFVAIVLFGLVLTCTSDKKCVTQVNFTYHVWIGDDVDTQYEINLTAPSGSHFIDAMFQAAGLDQNFAFDFIQYDFGKFITTIAGVSNNEATSQFWMIYNLPFVPNTGNPPGDEYLSPVGVDLIEVQDGYHYLFWYRTVDLSTHT